MANMASSLILHKRINTTLAKAKALRTYVEPLLTKAKNDTIHSRRTVFAYLKDKTAVGELFRDISNKIADRPGGYTRIIKLGNRLGDNAELAMIELVDYNENLLKETKTGKQGQKKTRRRGTGKSAKTAEKIVPAEVTEVNTEEVPSEVTPTEESTEPQMQAETDSTSESATEAAAESDIDASAETKSEDSSEENPKTDA